MTTALECNLMIFGIAFLRSGSPVTRFKWDFYGFHTIIIIINLTDIGCRTFFILEITYKNTSGWSLIYASFSSFSFHSYEKQVSVRKYDTLFLSQRRDKFLSKSTESTLHYTFITNSITAYVRGMFKKYADCLNCAARVGFRRIRSLSSGSYRSAD